MGSIITKELAISILSDAVKTYELIISEWEDAPLEIKTRLYEEKKNMETRLLELYSEQLGTEKTSDTQQ